MAAGGKQGGMPWPPLIYSGALLLAWVLQRFDAFLAGDAFLGQLPRAVGVAVFALGIAIDLWAFFTLRKAGTTVMPQGTPKALVTTGPYRWSRNPIYLGNTLAMLGFALSLRWTWLLLLVPVTITAVNWLAIADEEATLERRFGDAWRQYEARTRRWL